MYKASSKEYFDDIVYVDKAIKLRVHLSFFDGHCSRAPCCYSHTTLVDISKLRCVIHLIGKRNSKGCKSNLQVIVANDLLDFFILSCAILQLFLFNLWLAVADLHSKILDAPPRGSKFFQFHAVFGEN